MVSLYDGCKSFSPARVIYARSVDDISNAIVVAAGSGLALRPMGLGYSWSEHSFTSGISLHLAPMRSFCHVDREKKTVTVDAGVRMGDVTRALARQGLSLPSLAFLPEMTAGGAVATATHGTNGRCGTMSDFVNSMDLVLATGEQRQFRDHAVSTDEMRAARVAVGMLGVITRIEFQAIDMPWVRYTKLELDLDVFMQDRMAILDRYDHVWVHWTLGTNTVIVDCLETRATSREGFYPYVNYRNASWEEKPRSPLKDAIRPAWRMLQDVIRPRLSVTRAKSQSHARTSMQYAVSTTQWEQVVEAIKNSTFAKSNAGQVMEMKFVKGTDRSFLGPNAGQDVVCFNVYWMVPRSELANRLVPFEDLMRGFDARPHWGKDHRSPTRDYMLKAYPQWQQFETVRKTFDKDDVFLTIKQ